MKRNRFYKTSPHGGVGSNVAFYGIKGYSYVTDVDKAMEYTLEEAQKCVDDGLRFCREREIFLSADHVDALTRWKVDCQYVELAYPDVKDPNDEYVAYQKNCWDGNDLCFAAKVGKNFDYSKALTLNESDLTDIDLVDWVIVPKFHTDEIARRVFEYDSINRRKMISGAGLIGIHAERKKVATTGKCRWNCPTCGKISWQYNPYDFEGCADTKCKGYFDY